MASYRSTWDLTTIPSDKLAQEYGRRRREGELGKPGRPKLPRCRKCGEVKREGHVCGEVKNAN